MSIHAMSTYLMPEAVLGFGKGEKKKKKRHHSGSSRSSNLKAPNTLVKDKRTRGWQLSGENVFLPFV